MDKSKVLILGNGYIGSAFKDIGYTTLGKEELNITDSLHPYELRRIKDAIEPFDVVINCIAKTDTKWSEIPENFDSLMKTNAYLVQMLSNECKLQNKKFIHISTGDLYGNIFACQECKENLETSTKLDANTNYRLSKLVGEKFCHPNDLILRIRLPFDARNHPKNLLMKSKNYANFYSHVNMFTYVPDLLKAVEILIDKDESGIFNIVQPEARSLLYLWRNLLKFPHLQHIDLHQPDHPNLNFQLDRIHIHNTMNTEKFRSIMEPKTLEVAWILAWETLKNTLQMSGNSV